MSEPHNVVRSAAVTALKLLLPSVPRQLENVTPTKSTGLWISLFTLPTDTTAATLGSAGENEHTGILQIDINVPLNTGEKELFEKVEILRGAFDVGRHLTSSGLTIIFGSYSLSSGRNVDSWFRRSLSLAYRTRTTRTY